MFSEGKSSAVFYITTKKYVVGLELELVWKVSTENGGLERKSRQGGIVAQFCQRNVQSVTI